jgi:hypothetical protein
MRAADVMANNDGDDNDDADNGADTDEAGDGAAVEVDIEWPRGPTFFKEAFAEQCAALQRNDPRRTYVYYPYDVPGHGRRLGQALVGNSYVSDLHLCLVPGMIDDGPVDFESIRLIVQYLREGPAIRTLCIWDGIRDYIGLCVTAIAQNPNAVELILNEQTEVPEDEVVNLLRTSQSIKEIVMPMVNSIVIAEAFAANQTLTHITLTFNPDADLPPPNGVILRHLIAHRPPCSLTIYQKFHTIGSAEVDAELAAFLVSAKWLKELRMMGIAFHQNGMLEALLSNRSIEKLSLDCCAFDRETVAVLRDMTHASANRLAASMIREIHIVERGDHLADLSAESVALIVLGMPGLQVLNWKRAEGESLDAFWNMLAAKASLVRLSVLRIVCWPDMIRQEMNNCLPLLPSLQELHFHLRQQYEDWEPHAFLDAVMKCPRLHDITLDNAFPHFWSEDQARLARALFQRNQLLYQLVSMPRLDHMVQEDEDSAEICLYPSLFFAAKRSAVVAPNSILAGLLALSDAIGFV